jgi:predicted ester cyclase
VIQVATTHDAGQQNKDVVRSEFDSAWNQGEFDEAWYTKDFQYHGLAEEPVAYETYTDVVSSFHEAFPDMKKTVEDCICEGDRVLVRYSAAMTHEGELMGIDPSGEHVEATGMVLYRIEEDRIAEGWINYDTLGIMQQIGAFSGPAPK